MMTDNRVAFHGVPEVDPDELCLCGHERLAHLHLRRGTDCSLCGRSCCRYRQPTHICSIASFLRNALHRLREA